MPTPSKNEPKKGAPKVAPKDKPKANLKVHAAEVQPAVLLPAMHVDLKLVDGQEVHEQGAVLLTDTFVMLDDSKAIEYCNLPIFPGEREAKDIHVQELVDKINQREFNELIVIIASCWLDGVRYKINGQHTCWAKIALPHWRIQVRELIYQAKTLTEVKRLYAQFDANKPRTDGHLTKMHLADSVVFAMLWGATKSRFGSALKFWLFPKKEEAKRIKCGDVTIMMENRYPELIRQCGVFVQSLASADARALARVGVAAAMLETFNKAPQVALTFWTAVATGAELKVKDARLTLRNYLLTSAVGNKGFDSHKRVVDSESVYRHCVNCWNKWRKGEPLSVLKVPDTRPKAR